MTKLMLRFTLLGAILACLSAYAGESTTVFKATYKGKHSGFKVKTTRELHFLKQNQYVLKTTAKSMFASIKETSTFILNSQGYIVPSDYHYKRSVFGVSKEKKLSFDWQKNLAYYFEKGDKESQDNLPLEKGLLDEPTFQLQLQRELKAQPDAATYIFRYAKPGKIKQQTFYHYGSTKLAVKGDKLDALFLSTEPPKGHTEQTSDKIIQVWIIPEFNFQIGKIKFIDEDDESYEMTITDYSFDAKQIEKL